MLYFGEPEIALWGYLATVLICAFGPLRFEDESVVFQSFLLVPVIRLVNLGMPVFVDLTLYWLILLYVPLLPAVFLVVRVTAVVNLSIGGVGNVLSTPAFVLLGIVLAEVEYYVLPTEALIPAMTIGGVITLIVVMVAGVALTEELLFRGLLQRALEDRIGFVAGLVLASGIYGMMHAGGSSLMAVAFGITFGLLLGAVYDWTDSLVPVVSLHGTSNVFLYGVIPIRGSMLPVDAFFAAII